MKYLLFNEREFKTIVPAKQLKELLLKYEIDTKENIDKALIDLRDTATLNVFPETECSYLHITYGQHHGNFKMRVRCELKLSFKKFNAILGKMLCEINGLEYEEADDYFTIGKASEEEIKTRGREILEEIGWLQDEYERLLNKRPLLIMGEIIQ